MSITYYLINGNAYTWNELHNNMGYTEEPSEEFSYKSAGYDTWGDYVGNGYAQYDDEYNYFTYTFFASGHTGWFDIGDLASVLGLYPSDCSDTELTNGTNFSPAVYFEVDGDAYYLIRDALSLGWLMEDELEENGWYHDNLPAYEFILVDATTGKVSYGVESISEMEFVETGYFTIDGSDDVVFVNQSPYPIRCNYSQVYSPNPTIADGGTLAFDYPQYASKLYIPIVITINHGAFTTYYYGWDMGDGVVVNNNGESLTVFSLILVFIDSANASIVTVVDSNNSFRRAFKYTLNGTDYYYVIDGENEFWTDDLLDIDYTLYPWPVVRSHSGTQTAASVAADASFDTGMEWDSGLLYIGETNDGQGNVTRYGWEPEEAEPVVNPVAWFYSDKSSFVLNGDSYLHVLYDSSGNYIDYNANATYTLVRLLDANGDTITPYDEYGNELSIDNVLLGFYPYNATSGYGKLSTRKWYMSYNSSGQSLSVNGIEYTVS